MTRSTNPPVTRRAFLGASAAALALAPRALRAAPASARRRRLQHREPRGARDRLPLPAQAAGWTSTRRRSPRPTRRPGGRSARRSRPPGSRPSRSGRRTPRPSRSTRRRRGCGSGSSTSTTSRRSPTPAGVRQETLRIAGRLGIPHVDGGLRDNTPEQATALCREHGVRFNIENHPEKSAAEILAKIGGGNEWLGVCIDMGWLGTQGVVGPGGHQGLRARSSGTRTSRT